jgi:hypothetical protein
MTGVYDVAPCISKSTDVTEELPPPSSGWSQARSQQKQEASQRRLSAQHSCEQNDQTTGEGYKEVRCSVERNSSWGTWGGRVGINPWDFFPWPQYIK